MPLSDFQQKFVAIVPKVTGGLSIVGSSYIIWHVASSRKRLSKPYHRLLLNMSAQDLIYSVRSFVSTWAIPSDTPGVYMNVGNTQTCTAAGFFGHGSALSRYVRQDDEKAS